MDKRESQVDDVVVVENSEKVSKSLNSNEKEWKKIIVSDEGKRRTKKLFEKAMLRDKKNKILKGHEILDCDVIELNDSNDFSHQSKLLRTEKVNQKPKPLSLHMPSTSVSVDDSSSFRQGPSKKVREISSNTRGKEGPPGIQPRSSKSNVERTCRLCFQEFPDTALKDHMLSCMKHNFEHITNDTKKENLEMNPCCHLCGKDLSLMSNAKRASHINACLDQKEDEKKQREELVKQLQQAQSIILNCPVCQKKFRSTMSRIKHLKKCALSNKMSVEQIKNLAKQQEEEHKKRLDAGILPEDIKASLLKNTKGKPKAKKRLCEEDEDIQLAIALSTSLTEEREKTQGSSLQNAQSSKSTNLLLNLSKNQAEERICKRAASLIFNASPPEESASQTPAFKRRKQELDSPQRNKYWDKTSLASPLKTSSSSNPPPEQEQLKQQCSLPSPYKISSVSRDIYYVPVLMPPVTVDDTYVGSKLKPVSAIPGRQRSMDWLGRRSEEEVIAREEVEVSSESNTGLDSIPHVEVQSQTVADLAELAAENEDSDSESSEDLFEPNILSLDSKEGTEEDKPSGEALHQIEVDSCELKKLSSSFLSLVNCPKYSDVQIATSNEEFVSAHQIVLYARCPELYKRCDHYTIDLSNYSKRSVLCVLKYIYGGEISLMNDSVEDVISICKSLCLSSLLEKAEKMWNEKKRSTSPLNREKADEDRCPESLKEEERDKSVDRASSMDHDAHISNHSLENVISLKLNNEGEEEGSKGVCQPDSFVKQVVRNANEQCLKLEDIDEIYSGDKDKQGKEVDELLAQKTGDNGTTQVNDRQQFGDIAYDGHKQSKQQSNVCENVNRTNNAPKEESSDNSESLSTAKFTDDAKTQRHETSFDVEDNDCTFTSAELKNSHDREEMHDNFATERTVCAEMDNTSVFSEVEMIKTPTIGDAMPLAGEHSKTIGDPFQSAQRQSTFQSTSDQQIFKEGQASDEHPILTQLPLPDSKMVQPLCNNPVPACENEVRTPLSLPVTELINTSAAVKQGLNESLLQISNISSLMNEDTKSKGKSKKVSRKEFKDLVSKAVDGSLTEQDFEKIKIKIEQDNSFLDKDVYIPSVLDDKNSPNPDELQITNAFIRPQKFKSKIRGERSLKKGNQSLDQPASTEQQITICERGQTEIPVTKPPVVSFPHQNDFLLNSFHSLSASKISPSEQNLNVSFEKDNCPSESKLSTSCNSDILLNSDDDLFDDIEEDRDRKLTNCSTDGADTVSTISVMDLSVGGLSKATNVKSERKGLERNKAKPSKIHGSEPERNLSSWVNGQNARFSEDSQKMQMELASAISAEIQNVRNAEELSQSEGMDIKVDIFPIRQSRENVESRSTTYFQPSTKPPYAESTPGTESCQVNELSLLEQLPGCITPIKKPSELGSPNLNSSVGSSGKKKTQRGLARLKKNLQTSSPSNGPNITTTNSCDVKSSSDSSCCASRMEGDRSGNGKHANRNGTLNKSAAAVDKATQLVECRRHLNFDGQTTNVSEFKETCSRLPTSSFGSKQTLTSVSLLPSSVVTKQSDRMGGNESLNPTDKCEALMNGIRQCNTNIIAPHALKITNSTLPDISKSSFSFPQTPKSSLPQTPESTISTLLQASKSSSNLPQTPKSASSSLSQTPKSTISTLLHTSKPKPKSTSSTSSHTLKSSSTLPYTSKSSSFIVPHTLKSTSSTLPQTPKSTSPSSPHMSKATDSYLSELANSFISHSSTGSSSETSFRSTKSRDNENLRALHQASNEIHSNSVQLSLVDSYSEQKSRSVSSNYQSATTSTPFPSTPSTPNANCPQTETIGTTTTPPSLSKGVFMAYSPLIKKGKGASNSALTDVNSMLPCREDDLNRNNYPLSSLLIDSAVSANLPASFKKASSSVNEDKCKRNHNNKGISGGVDFASNSGSLPEGNDVIVPLRERLGIANPFGMKAKQMQSTGSPKEGKSDKAYQHVTDVGASTSKTAVLNQDECRQSVHKRNENQQINRSLTPSGQMMSREKKQRKEPSPFTPMPSYDEMDTPQLKKEVSKIGVRPMNKKRMNMVLKEVYRETHQYETDSDYEPTPVKQKRMDSPTVGIAQASSVSHGEGNSFVPAISSIAKHTSSSGDANSDAKEGEDPPSSSQESSNSDVEELAEESILQGWPDEEEVNPTQMTQSGSETITQRLLVFLRTNLDVYEKILIYEPLELDVLKKRLSEAGIRIGISKLMDFLDEQCITFSMKNMSNRNNRPQKGRMRAGKAS